MGVRISGAQFRAVREMCGMTQQMVAVALSVTTKTVKRWESGAVPVPQDAREFMAGAAAHHAYQSDAMVSDIMADVDYDGAREVTLEYYRSQEQLVEATGDRTAHQIVNAITRTAAARVAALGVDVSFAYPDE